MTVIRGDTRYALSSARSHPSGRTRISKYCHRSARRTPIALWASTTLSTDRISRLSRPNSHPTFRCPRPPLSNISLSHTLLALKLSLLSGTIRRDRRHVRFANVQSHFRHLLPRRSYSCAMQPEKSGKSSKRSQLQTTPSFIYNFTC